TLFCSCTSRPPDLASWRLCCSNKLTAKARRHEGDNQEAGRFSGPEGGHLVFFLHLLASGLGVLASLLFDPPLHGLAYRAGNGHPRAMKSLNRSLLVLSIIAAFSPLSAFSHSAVDPVSRGDQGWKDRQELLNKRAAEAGEKAQIIFIGD